MNASLPTSDAGSITRVAGIEVGHFTDARRRPEIPEVSVPGPSTSPPGSMS